LKNILRRIISAEETVINRLNGEGIDIKLLKSWPVYIQNISLIVGMAMATVIEKN
jgi:hypothetical protein